MKIKFVSIALDPNGVYVGFDQRGWLWHYAPLAAVWVLFFTGDDAASD